MAHFQSHRGEVQELAPCHCRCNLGLGSPRAQGRLLEILRYQVSVNGIRRAFVGQSRPSNFTFVRDWLACSCAYGNVKGYLSCLDSASAVCPFPSNMPRGEVRTWESISQLVQSAAMIAASRPCTPWSHEIDCFRGSVEGMHRMMTPPQGSMALGSG